MKLLIEIFGTGPLLISLSVLACMKVAANDQAAASALQWEGILVTISSGIAAISRSTLCMPLTTWQTPSGSQTR